MDSKKEHQQESQVSTKTQQSSSASSASSSSSSSFSWLNFQTIHILVEIVTICGISYYFNRKVSAMTKQLEDLHARLEEQDKILQNHEDVLKKLISNYRQQQQIVTPPQPQLQSQSQPQPQLQSQPQPQQHLPASSSSCAGGVCPVEPKQRAQTPLTIPEKIPAKDPVKFGESLDDELQEELSELSKSKE